MLRRLCVSVVIHENRQLALKEQQPGLEPGPVTASLWVPDGCPGYLHVQS